MIVGLLLGFVAANAMHRRTARATLHRKAQVEGSTKKVAVKIDGEYTLAASGAKELGSAAIRALTSPETVPGRRVRGEDTVSNRDLEAAGSAA